MAITFNSTALSAITFNSNPIDIATYNGTVVYENAAYYSMPRSADNVAMTSNSSYGFNASGSTVFSSSFQYFKSFDSSSSTVFKTPSSSPILLLKFIDPNDQTNPGLGDVTITKVTVSYSDNLSGATIYVGDYSALSSKTVTVGSNAKIFASSIAGNGEYAVPSNLSNFTCNCVRISKSGASGDTQFGNVTVFFKVGASKLAAWKAKYPPDS